MSVSGHSFGAIPGFVTVRCARRELRDLGVRAAALCVWRAVDDTYIAWTRHAKALLRRRSRSSARLSLKTPLMAVVPLGIHQVGQLFVAGPLALGVEAGAQRPRHAQQAHLFELVQGGLVVGHRRDLLSCSSRCRVRCHGWGSSAAAALAPRPSPASACSESGGCRGARHLQRAANRSRTEFGGRPVADDLFDFLHADPPACHASPPCMDWESVVEDRTRRPPGAASNWPFPAGRVAFLFPDGWLP